MSYWHWHEIIEKYQSNFESGLVLFLLFSGLAMTIACIFHIQFRLKVTFHVKRVLLFQGISIVSTLLLQSAGYIIEIIGTTNRNVSCALQISSAPARFAMNIFFTMALAIIRFYMADRTGRNRQVNHAKIKEYSFASAIVNWLIWIVVFACGPILGIHLVPIAAECAGSDHSLGAIFSLLNVIGLAISIFYDIKLVKFVRQQNRIQPVRMEAWTVEEVPLRRSNLDDTLKDTVPVTSTIISCSFLIFNLALLVLLAYPGFKLAILISGNVTSILHFPLVLTFTVKSKSKKKAARVIPPSGLQYHDPIDNTCSNVLTE